MDTTICPFCMEKVKIGAIKCKHCHSSLTQASNSVIPEQGKSETLWLPVPAFVLSIIALLCLFDNSKWDSDTTIGFFMFAILGFVLSIISVSTQKMGKGMAIARIVISVISILAGVGILSEQ